MRKPLFIAFQIAAIYIGTVVGAGFATGKEIVAFFTKYHEGGLVGIILSTILLSILSEKMMLIGKRINAQSYQELNIYLFGPFFGNIVNGIMIITLIGVTSVMLSGAGAIFEEQLSLSKIMGIIITIVLAIYVMKYGVKGLSSVNVFVVPIFIFFSIILAGDTFHFKSISLENVSFNIGLLASGSSFLYAAFNLTLAQAVLVPLATQINHEKAIRLGARIGGIGLGLILLLSHIALLSLPNVESFDIPMAQLVKGSLSSIYYLYLLVIFGEVFTSVIGNLYGIERQIKAKFHFSSTKIVSSVLFIAFFISLIGYSDLITRLYPLFGYMSIVFILCLTIKKVPH